MQLVTLFYQDFDLLQLILQNLKISSLCRLHRLNLLYFSHSFVLFLLFFISYFLD